MASKILALPGMPGPNANPRVAIPEVGLVLCVPRVIVFVTGCTEVEARARSESLPPGITAGWVRLTFYTSIRPQWGVDKDQVEAFIMNGFPELSLEHRDEAADRLARAIMVMEQARIRQLVGRNKRAADSAMEELKRMIGVGEMGGPPEH
jgi:hypothetical protein